jgi:hypothetical protein
MTRLMTQIMWLMIKFMKFMTHLIMQLITRLMMKFMKFMTRLMMECHTANYEANFLANDEINKLKG